MKKHSKKQNRENRLKKNQVNIAKQVIRSWDLATRLEYRRVKGKESRKNSLR